MSEELLSKIEASTELRNLTPKQKATLLETAIKLQKHVKSVTEAKLSSWESNFKTERVITRDRLIEKLAFDTSTGDFTWKTTYRKGLVAGYKATERGKTYVRIRIDDELIMAHALVWLYVHNEWPAFEIDHINGIGTDNRPENLRRSNRLLNNSNTRKRKDAAEHKNIQKTPNGKYTGVVKYAKLPLSIGTYKALETAIAVRDFLESLTPRLESHGIDKID